MSKGDTFENDLLKLIFHGTAIANIADNAASAPLTNLYVSLHSADPGENGTQATNEVSYGSYARVASARSAAGWTITGNQVVPAANILFPQASSGSTTASHVGIGVAASGATKLLYKGALSPTIAISTGVQPIVTTGSVLTED